MRNFEGRMTAFFESEISNLVAEANQAQTEEADIATHNEGLDDCIAQAADKVGDCLVIVYAVRLGLALMDVGCVTVTAVWLVRRARGAAVPGQRRRLGAPRLPRQGRVSERVRDCIRWELGRAVRIASSIREITS